MLKLDADFEFIKNLQGELTDSFTNSSWFITGATGFIGKWILGYLLYLNQKENLNLKITALSRDPEKFLYDYPEFKTNSLKILKGDISKPINSNERFDFIIHAATDVANLSEAKNFSKIFETSLFGSKNIAELCSRNPQCKLLFLSSGAVYGKQPSDLEFVDESCLLSPNTLLDSSAYGEGKRVGEWILTNAARIAGFECKIARCFAFVGPFLSLDGPFAIGNFIRDVINKKDIVIQGDGTAFRSYLYAAELVHWLLTILLSGKTGEAYNVGSMEPISIEKTAKTVLEISGLNLQIEIKQKPVLGRNPDRYVPSIKKAEIELGLVPILNLSESVRRTLNWHIGVNND